jgi:thiamine-monophosphate kinase
MVIGAVPRGRAILRSTAKAGDTIYVTGSLGGSASTISNLSSRAKPAAEAFVRKSSRHFYPDPRLAVAAYLQAKKLAHAMIDLSDGLSTDLGHICDASKVGAILNRDLIPISASVTLHDALHGGEDYELLFTASPRAPVPVAIAGVPVTEIGWVTRERGVYLSDMKSKPTRLRPQGWEHFRKN